LSHTRNLAKRDNTVPLSLSPAHETYALAAELDGLGVKMQPNHIEQHRTDVGISIILCGPVWRLISAATIYVFLVGLDLGFLCSLRAVAQNSDTPLSLPHLETCQHVSHPLLPPKWRGVFLMAPFTASQLALSEIIYDGSLPAMLVKLYGVRSGATRLFVIGSQTYLLPQDGSDGRCEGLGDTGWRPLPRDWLTEGAQCAGSAPLSETSVQWWKTPTQPAPLADWIWFKSSDQSPFRLLFQKPGDQLSIFSSYALSYQVRFETIPETDLAAVALSCQPNKRAQQSGRSALHNVLRTMESSGARANKDINRLFPELDSVCPTARPTWPEALGMTMVLTPLDFHTNPVAAEVQYSWKLRSQRTRMFWPAGSPIAHEDVLMLAARGYSVTHTRAGDVQCLAALPGTPRPNWIREAPCACEAVIKGTTSLTPYGSVQILRCPATKPRIFWTWYTFDGRPMVFMVTPSSGDEPTALITLADYFEWRPGYVASEGVFEKPVQCLDTQIHSQTKGPPRSPEPCGRCHLTPDRPR
jgi:hypothetical protein